jgi:hypothetical protein
MSIYAQFDDDGLQMQIDSNRGYGEFCQWVESLRSAPHLNALTEDGAISDIAGLRAEIDDALTQSPPSRNVAGTVEALRQAIDTQKGAEQLFITNGMHA